MQTGIYQILNTVTGKRYIGSAINIKKRWHDHVKSLTEKKHHSRHLQRAWDKYGKEVFVFSILIECKQNELLIFEQSYFDKEKPEYNICPIAGNSLGVKWSDESRAKISAQRKGKVLSPEVRAKLSEAHKGKIRSPEHCANLAKSLTGKKLSPQHRANLSAGQRGKPRSPRTPEHCAKISERMIRQHARRKVLREIFDVWRCAI